MGNYEIKENELSSSLVLAVEKQRNAEWEGLINLWHIKNQFRANDTASVVNFDLGGKQ